MNGHGARPRVQSCANCRSALSFGAIACSSCGGVVPIEIVSRRFREQRIAIYSFIRERLRERGYLIWVMALTPVLIGPPLCALLIVALRINSERQLEHAALIVAVALVNVIVGLFFWHWLSQIMVGIGPYLLMLFKSFGVEHDKVPRTWPV
jgi:hypothetical protein